MVLGQSPPFSSIPFPFFVMNSLFPEFSRNPCSISSDFYLYVFWGGFNERKKQTH